MEQKYFIKHVKRCRDCKTIPQIRKVFRGENAIFENEKPMVRYQVVCPKCEEDWSDYGNRTGYYKEPKIALWVWNKDYGMEE